MARSPRVRRVVPAVLLALAPVVVGGSAATGAPPPAGAARAVSMPVPPGSQERPCRTDLPCETPVVAGVGMAVPLVKTALRGTDGGWSHFTICCTGINLPAAGTLTGSLNDHPAAVVPAGGTGIAAGVDGSATASVVYAVSGASYRYARFASLVSVDRENNADPASALVWTVSSDVWSWPACRQRGATRVPATDCGNGTQQYTRGRLGPTPRPANPQAYEVALPISYWARTVDSRARPLANPYKTSTGHWILRTQAAYHGWLWTVEWSVGNVGIGRVAGSSYISGDRIVLTTSPFT